MRRPSDPNYEGTTLHVPKDYRDRCSEMMTQYWDIKADNYDKIVLLKQGKFYEMYNDDAIICKDLLHLNLITNKTLNVGFQESGLDKNVAILVEAGYKVAVVEQTESSRNR